MVTMTLTFDIDIVGVLTVVNNPAKFDALAKRFLFHMRDLTFKAKWLCSTNQDIV